MAKIKVIQVKSGIGSCERQKRTLKSLGLKKLHKVVEHEDSPSVLGMIEKVKHLVVVE